MEFLSSMVSLPEMGIVVHRFGIAEPVRLLGF